MRCTPTSLQPAACALVVVVAFLAGCKPGGSAPGSGGNSTNSADPMAGVPRRALASPPPRDGAGPAPPPAPEKKSPERQKRKISSDPEQLFQEAMIYWHATGADRDSVEAAKLFHLAAETGHVRAQAYLGSAYRTGVGVAHDPVQTVKWFKAAAEQGHPLSQAVLGSLYMTGECTEKNPAEAVKWFRQAADHGQVEAMGNLGAMLYLGQGVATNYVEAYKWLHLAAQRGNQLAVKNRGEVSKRLTPAQMAEGRKLATEFQPRAATNSTAGAQQQ
jgi:hypothetical protein